MIRCGILTAIALLSMTSPGLTADSTTVVYRWDAGTWLKSYNQVQFTASAITNADGSTGAKVTVTPRDAVNPYNHIIVTSASLEGGNEYTAVITFSVVEPTTYPNSFYMFARNSAGNQYDIWRTWIGLPGETRTITMPLDLKAIDNGTWKFFMGISKSGALNINSIVIYRGLTSDGKRNFIATPLATGASSPANVPKGVKAATGFTAFSITPPSAPVATVSLADYHLVADSENAPPAVAEENAVELQRAISACKNKGATKLVIPKGTYRISTAPSIVISGLSDLSVDGQGSILIFERLAKDGPAIIISDCARLIIENLSLDWDWSTRPIASLGIVSNLTSDRLQCDFTFPDLNAAQTSVTRTTPWQGIFPMDRTHLWCDRTGNFGVPKSTRVGAGSADNVLHVTFPTPVQLIDGSSYCVRHLYYEMGGFKVTSSSDVNFQNVNIYSMPGMGWFFAGAMHNFQLTGCKILRAPGSRRPLTTAADGIHVDQFVDNLNIENCSITGTGDDAMNIHSECYQGNIVLDEKDPTKMTLMNCASWQLRLASGDPLEIYNADFSYLNKSGTPSVSRIASTSSINRGRTQTDIQLATPVPAGVTPQSIVLNGRLKGRNVRIAGCNLEYTNGRGILLSTTDALIEGCLMRNVFASGINLESEIVQPLWTEGRGASNVVIRGNRFENCNQAQRYNGAMIYTNAHFPWGPSTTILYDQVAIEGNRFLNCPGPILSFSNGNHLIVRSNEIVSKGSILSLGRYAGTIFVTDSSNLSLGGNRWTYEIPTGSGIGVVHDPATTSNVSLGTNVIVGKH